MRFKRLGIRVVPKFALHTILACRVPLEVVGFVLAGGALSALSCSRTSAAFTPHTSTAGRARRAARCTLQTLVLTNSARVALDLPCLALEASSGTRCATGAPSSGLVLARGTSRARASTAERASCFLVAGTTRQVTELACALSSCVLVLVVFADDTLTLAVFALDTSRRIFEGANLTRSARSGAVLGFELTRHAGRAPARLVVATAVVLVAHVTVVVACIADGFACKILELACWATVAHRCVSSSLFESSCLAKSASAIGCPCWACTLASASIASTNWRAHAIVRA